MIDTHLDTPPGKPGKIRTFTGRMVDPWALLPEDIQIEDIAHSLSQQCRFTGHTNVFYSVAEHCLLVSTLLTTVNPDKVVLGGLVHDAAEAYFGDMAGPSKRRVPMHEYAVAEHIAADTIMLALVGQLTEDERVAIHRADTWAYYIERKQLMRPGYMEPCIDDPDDQTVPLGSMSIQAIEQCYLTVFKQLTNNLKTR